MRDWHAFFFTLSLGNVAIVIGGGVIVGAVWGYVWEMLRIRRALQRALGIKVGLPTILRLLLLKFSANWPRFPRMWDLLGFLFSRNARDRLWTPVVEEDKLDYLMAMRQYRSRLARAWLRACFVVRTFVRLLQCSYVLSRDRVARFLGEVLLHWIR